MSQGSTVVSEAVPEMLHATQAPALDDAVESVSTLDKSKLEDLQLLVTSTAQ